MNCNGFCNASHSFSLSICYVLKELCLVNVRDFENVLNLLKMVNHINVKVF